MINEGKPVVWLFLYIRYLSGPQTNEPSKGILNYDKVICCKFIYVSVIVALLTLHPVLHGLLLPTASYYLPKSHTLLSNCKEKEQRGIC